jgi:hypothetical protein
LQQCPAYPDKTTKKFIIYSAKTTYIQFSATKSVLGRSSLSLLSLEENIAPPLLPLLLQICD